MKRSASAPLDPVKAISVSSTGMAGGPSGLADEGSGLQVLLVLSNVSGLVGGRWFEEGYVWLRSRGSRVLPGSTGGMD